MKLKLANLIEPATGTSMHPAIARFANLDLPIKTSFRLKGIIKQAVEHFNAYLAYRLDLYKKHGEHNAETDEYTVPESNLAAFRTEFDELLDTDIEITGEPFKLASFHSSTAIRTNDLMALEWLIDDGQPVPLALVPESPADESTDLLDLGDERQSKTAAA